MSAPFAADAARAAAGLPDTSPCSGAPDESLACPGRAAGSRSDLTWLVHRVSQRLRRSLDELAQREGLPGVREWLVLSSVAETPGRTQLALAQELGFDKTTMTALLDRLERDGLVVRRQDPRDRRARIPEVTDRGRTVQQAVAACHDAAEDAVVSALSASERQVLRELLGRVAHGAGDSPAGSCM